MCFIVVYAPTEVCLDEKKEITYVKLDSMLDKCLHRDTLIVLSDSSTTTDSERGGYDLCFGLHCSGPRNRNNHL